MKRSQTFEDLQCWQACRALRIFVARELVNILPDKEQFRLKDQLLRSARSTTANIAEGYGRFHYQDNAKFCRNARGSVYEVLDHGITGHDESYFTSAQLEQIRHQVDEAAKLLNGYINYLLRSKRGSNLSEEPAEYLSTHPDL